MSKKKLLREFHQLCPDGICDISRLTEAERQDMRDNGTVYLTGVIQRANAKNGNSRVYPREVLEREMKNYEKAIRENRAMGECVDEETQIMTSEGWKYLKDISEQEIVFVYDSMGQMRKEQIKRKIVIPFSGNMLHFSNNSNTLDMKLTPNHKVIIEDRNGKEHVFYAEDVATRIRDNDSFISHSRLKKSGAEWKKEKPEYFEVAGKKVKAEIWASFLGFYLAEGCCPVKRGHLIQITQKKEPEKNEFRKILKELPFDYKEAERKAAPGTVDFFLRNEELREYLSVLGKSYEKYIPEEVKDWHPEHLETLLKWMLIGDGRNRSRPLKKEQKKRNLHRELYTTSPQLADDVSELFYKLGTSASILTRVQKDRYVGDRLIEAKNSRLLYIVSEHSTKGISLDTRFVNVESVPYEGNVYCVETSTGNWMMRRNGHACWTHNCDHPEDSVVSLKNVSHILTEYWWKGDDVFGKLKILPTPSGEILKSLIKSGIPLGVSSRGLGSVKEHNGISTVSEDYNIICFDCVSEPSTDGAFMSLSESKVKTNIFSKADRLFRLLNDITGDQ